MRAPRPTGSASLNAARRQTELEQVIGGEPLDVLVIGGGITGTGVALDAAARGLRTALIEAEDLAFGTSRWSSKLAHGGLRYLATGDVGIAYESAVERGLLLRAAPHLVRGAPMLTPLLPAIGRRTGAVMAGGFFAGDLLRRAARTSSAQLPAPRRLSTARTLELAPALPARGLRGGLLAHDGQLTDDARLVVAVARTAAAHGAAILTRVRATAITDGGVSITDARAGERGTIRATAIINATGVWTPELGGPDGPRLQPSRGTHVVLDQGAMPGLRANLTLPHPSEHNRYLLVLPQQDGRIYLGLTDTAVETVEDVPTPAPEEIAELVSALEQVLGTAIAAEHVVGAFAGLRPLLAGGSTDTASSDLSRRHAVLRADHGTIHVVGGKLTTYRRMAEDAVDAAIEHAGLRAERPCVTRTLPLVGAQTPAILRGLVDGGLPALQVARFGTEASAVAALSRQDSSLAEPIAPGVAVTGAELRFAVQHEGAEFAGDLLDRRFRVGLVAADRAAALPAAQRALA